MVRMSRNKLSMLNYSMLLLILLLSIGTVSAESIRVGADLGNSTITAALANASNGDVILVSDGTYLENLTVDKEVTIRSENGSATTIINSGSNSTVINITASNVVIDGFDISYSGHMPYPTVYVYSASNCTLINNRISGGFLGTYLRSSSNTTFMNNTLDSSYIGIYLYSSTNSTLKDNSISAEMIGFGVSGNSLEEYIHDIDYSNLVDGKPICYLVNEADMQVPSDAGQVYVVNSTNITVKDLSLRNAMDGVAFINTSGSTIENVTAAGCNDGIYLLNSDHNVVRDVISSDNYCGIHNHNSDNNLLTGNTVEGNIYDGILLCHSENIGLFSNIAGENGDNGIYAYFAKNTTMTDNIVSGNGDDGIYVDNSTAVTLTGNNAAGNTGNGIGLVNSDDSALTSNTAIFNSDDGIDLGYSDNNTLASNTVTHNSESGFDFGYSNNNTLLSNIAGHNLEPGILLTESNYNVLNSNIANENAYAGIIIQYSGNNMLTNNTADSSTSEYSVGSVEIQDLEPLSNVLLTKHDTSARIDEDGLQDYAVAEYSLMGGDPTTYGIYIYEGDNTTLSQTHATDSNYALYIRSSQDITVDNTIVTNELAGISFTGDFYNLYLRERFSVPVSPAGKTNVNGYVDLFYSVYEPLGISGSSGPGSMNITLSYNDSGMSSAEENSISMFSLNGSTWVKVSNAVLSTGNNCVSATVTGEDVDIKSIMISYPTAEITLALFKNQESSGSGSSGSSVIARERREGTITDLPLGNDGELTKDTVVKSSGSTTTLTLFTGTKALDPLGNPVNSIIVTTPSSLPSDTPREVIESGLYFSFGPSGTTFSQDVMITMEFNPADFEGRTPVIYTYTSEDGWIALETTVDWENGRATAMISHFSLYALFGTDGEETPVIAAEAQGTDVSDPDVQQEGISVETEKASGVLFWVIGIVLILGIGVAIIMSRKKDGEL